MATKKFLELQDYTAEELANELQQTEAQFQRLSFDHSIRGLDNPLALREVRKDIARLKTEIRRREVAEMSKEELADRTKIRSRRRRQRKNKQ
ncbi:MAG TPA: 50S ribosomal protein L29 [Saprospiraceae bacterium]|nr:50S ribosomal protein L29 [Saprospiraceae bacterium]